MRAGRLRHKVEFQELFTQIDSEGDRVETWVDLFGYPISTEVAPVSGREYLSSQAVQSQLNTRMTVRYNDKFKPGIRAVFRGKVYKIEAVLPDPNSGLHYLTLMASEGVAYVGDAVED